MHVQCPTCHNGIELGEPVKGDVLCEACGSSFCLEPSSTRTFALTVAGRQIGRFELVSELGSGSFGTVFKARDGQLDRIVALKVPRVTLWQSAEERDRFLREARSTAQLRHPAIVPVHEVGEHDGMPFLVTDYIEGTTLSDRLTSGRPSFREAAEIVARIAEALHYAHSQGVIHRDVKSSNIMIDRDCAPLLMDFGMARREGGEATMTVEGQVLGTPAFMSPEQARGESHAVDGRSDVYSLGVVLYHMLTGELPFRGNTRMLIQQVLSEEPRPPRALNDRLPRDLDTITLKAMAKEPAARYGSAAALAQDLRRYLDGVPIAARPVGPIERVVRWVRRRPAAAGLLAASGVAAIAIGAAVVGAAYSHQLERANQRILTEKTAAEKARAAEAAEHAKAETNLYLSRFVIAERELASGNASRARELLEQCPAELRGLEWKLLWGQSHGESFSLRGHSDQVFSVAVSPDGRLIASGSWDKTIRIWNAATGQLLRTLPTESWVWCVAFSPDGKRLAAAGGLYNQLSEVRLFEVNSGRPERTLGGFRSRVMGLAFNPMGTTIAVGDNSGVLNLWNCETGELIHQLETGSRPVSSLAFHPKGELLAGGLGHFDIFAPPSPGEVKIWNAATGEEHGRITGHDNLISGIAFNRDGSLLATAGTDSNILLWETGSWRKQGSLRGHLQGVIRVSFSPDGSLLSSSEDSTARIWDCETGETRNILQGHSGPVNDAVFFPSGDRVVTAGADGVLKIWETRSRPGVQTVGRPRTSGHALAFSPDGRKFAAGYSDHSVELRDSATGEILHTLKGHRAQVWGAAFSPDGKLLATCGGEYDQTKIAGEVLLWDVEAAVLRRRLEGHSGCVFDVSFTPDGKRLVSGGGELVSGPGELVMWDVARGEVVRSLPAPPKSGVHSITVSPDGKRLASTSGEGIITIWDLDSGEVSRELKGHEGIIFSARFDGTGQRLVSGGIDQTVRVWDLTTDREPLVLRGHTNYVLCASFSPDGTRVASGSNDWTIKIWETAQGQEVLTLRGHQGNVFDVAFRPDGSSVASIGGDGAVKLWDASRPKGSEMQHQRP